MVLAQTFGDGLRDGFVEVGTTIVNFVPKLLGALLILIIGWFLARLIRGALRKILEAVGFDRLLDRSGVGEPIRNAGYTASGVITSIIYYMLMAVVLLLATEALGVDELTNLLRDLIAYMPRLFIAVIILVVAAAIGTWVADLVRPVSESQDMDWIPTAARTIVLAIGVVAAFETLDLAPVLVQSFVVAFFGTLGLALGVAFAIAFGVGGIDTAKQWWSKLAPRD
jgi:small-conductance mechanosensitive channel